MDVLGEGRVGVEIFFTEACTSTSAHRQNQFGRLLRD
jgi:hypothetical protein